MEDVRRYGQIRAAGVSAREIAAGRAGIRVHQGVYVRELTLDSSVSAALESVGPPAILSHLTAARLHGFDGADGLAGFWDPGPPMIDVTVPAERSVRKRVGVRIHRRPLTRKEVVSMGRWPVTSARRTLLDVALTVPVIAAVAMVDSALRRGKIRVSDLAELSESSLGRTGSNEARRTFSLADGRAESPLESVSRISLIEAKMPLIDLQLKVRDAAGRFLGRADFALGRDRVSLLGEADGRLVHEGARVEDSRREERLRMMGFEVVRWTWGDLLNAREELFGRIRALIHLAESR